MRIGIICHSSCGGSARIGTELSMELAHRGHRVHLFTRTTPFGYRDNHHQVVLHRIGLDREDHCHPGSLYTDWTTHEFQTFLNCLLQLIAEEGLDLLHFHYAIPFAFIAEEVKRSMGHKSPLLIGTLHGTDVGVYGRDPMIGPRLAETLRNMDGLTTVSLSHARLIKEVLGLEKFPEIIPNFVNLSRFRPRNLPQVNRQANGIIKDGPDGNRRQVKIAHLSNFRPVKDPQSMVNIFLGIRKKMDAELWLIGEGPESDKVKSLLMEQEAENDVRFFGFRDNIAPLLAGADLLLMSSLYESFCLAALEAMACGVPVLATNVGGLPEVVVHGKTGFLYPAGDHTSAVEYAINLLSNPDWHLAMRREAIRHARRFGHKQIVSIYEELYKRFFLKGELHESL